MLGVMFIWMALTINMQSETLARIRHRITDIRQGYLSTAVSVLDALVLVNYKKNRIQGQIP